MKLLICSVQFSISFIFPFLYVSKCKTIYLLTVTVFRSFCFVDTTFITQPPPPPPVSTFPFQDIVDASAALKCIQFKEFVTARVCMYSFISYTEYAMNFTYFLLACLLWSNPTVMPLWTIPCCIVHPHSSKCCFFVNFKNWRQGQNRAENWDGATTASNHHHQPLKALNKWK